jgi:acetylornithine deacetylase
VSGAAELLASLVETDSVNPALVPGGAGEAQIARTVHRWLAAQGLEVEAYDVRPGRPNVVGVRRGSGGGPSLVLCGHTDTVGYDGMEDPLTARVDGNRMHGRGSYDMKAGLAAAMWAAARIGPGELAGDVVVAAVVDEEHASLGTQALLERTPADAAIVAEPTGEGLDVCIAHKGFAWSEVTVNGRAAHGSRRDLGVDAIAHAGHVLVQVERRDRGLAGRRPHALVGTPSLHASTIEGGQEWSSYPARCSIRLERRTVPGESEVDLEDELDGILERARAGCPGLDASARIDLVRPPFEIAAEAPIAQLTREQARATGGASQFVGLASWNDSALFAERGIPTVVFGPGGAGAHAHEEWVDLRQLKACAAALESVARAFCA